MDLPQVRAAKANVAEDAVVITLDKKHDMYINDNPLVASELKEKLTALFKDRRRKEIFLRADRVVPYGEVVKVMAIIRAGGHQPPQHGDRPPGIFSGRTAPTLRSQWPHE